LNRRTKKDTEKTLASTLGQKKEEAPFDASPDLQFHITETAQ
jgi:hypothetical protein